MVWIMGPALRTGARLTSARAGPATRRDLEQLGRRGPGAASARRRSSSRSSRSVVGASSTEHVAASELPRGEQAQLVPETCRRRSRTSWSVGVERRRRRGGAARRGRALGGQLDQLVDGRRRLRRRRVRAGTGGSRSSDTCDEYPIDVTVRSDRLAHGREHGGWLAERVGCRSVRSRACPSRWSRPRRSPCGGAGDSRRRGGLDSHGLKPGGPIRDEDTATRASSAALPGPQSISDRPVWTCSPRRAYRLGSTRAAREVRKGLVK
jgi:hypothetical protein